MTDAPVPATLIRRYVAGFSAASVPPTGDVVLLVTDPDGNRVATAVVISDMDHTQVRELRDQLSTLLVIMGYPEPVPTVEEWAALVLAERMRASDKGYTTEHDEAHGLRHLLNWGIDYSRRGRALESSQMMFAALEVLDRG